MRLRSISSASRAVEPPRPPHARALAGAALLSLSFLPAAGFAAEQTGGACVRINRQEAVLEGGGLRVRGDVTNICTYVVRNVRVQVDTRDKDGQVLGTGEDFVEPSVLGAQEKAHFDVAVSTTVVPAAVNTTARWRRGGGY